MKNTGFYVAYSHFMGVGPHKFSQLVSHFPSLEAAYNAHEKDLAPVMGPHLASKFVQFRNTFDIPQKLDEIAEAKITVLTRESAGYPPALLHISDPPICLYVKGNVDAIDFKSDMFFSIVGTRSPTNYGLYISELFATELASRFVIVSGLALGIDVSAHNAALEAGGRTIAILGCGVDIPAPRENTPTYDCIVAGGGLVISEFPPGMVSLKGHFVSRNRLVSGLSCGILVVEGNKRSGTLITARYAAEQGKDVFAPPAPINSDKSEAPNILLQNGAKLVLSPSDVFSEYGIGVNTGTSKRFNIEVFGALEQLILKTLLNESRRIDDIIRATGMVPNEVMKTLTVLEVNGVIAKNADGTYGLLC